MQIDNNIQMSAPRNKINRHTKSDCSYINFKIGNEKNLLLLEDVYFLILIFRF
jgi:hypothetical protein